MAVTRAICVLVAFLVGAVTSHDPCLGVDCPMAKCVDGVFDEDACCTSCPTGTNCWLEGAVVSGTTVRAMGDRCTMLCSCPSRHVYETYGDQTQAQCFMQCGDTSFSHEQVYQIYGLGNGKRSSGDNALKHAIRAAMPKRHREFVGEFVRRGGFKTTNIAGGR